MIYVTSDLHGCSPEAFEGFLHKIGFSDEDFLFVLGDVIDRGTHGAQLLLWLTEQPNMQLILGNHEALMLACDFVFGEANEQNLDSLTVEQLNLIESWIHNGGGPTMVGLQKMLKRDPELVEGILDYLRDAPLYEYVEAGGSSYILVHGGLGNFREDRPLDDYDPEELLMMRPDPDTRYFTEEMVILGHTPTEFFGEQYRGRAFHGDGWINIDTGAAMGNTPMVLRLDDRKEFYWE